MNQPGRFVGLSYNCRSCPRRGGSRRSPESPAWLRRASRHATASSEPTRPRFGRAAIGGARIQVEVSMQRHWGIIGSGYGPVRRTAISDRLGNRRSSGSGRGRRAMAKAGRCVGSADWGQGTGCLLAGRRPVGTARHSLRRWRRAHDQEMTGTERGSRRRGYRRSVGRREFFGRRSWRSPHRAPMRCW
jgi:hypothetical protein